MELEMVSGHKITEFPGELTNHALAFQLVYAEISPCFIHQFCDYKYLSAIGSCLHFQRESSTKLASPDQ